MSKIVLLTGAGCSAAAGMLTLKNVIEGIQIPFDSRNPSLQTILDTWKSVQAQRGIDDATLEDLIGVLKTYSQVTDMIRNNPVFGKELEVDRHPRITNGQFKMVWENALAYCLRLVLDTYGPHRVETGSEGFKTIHDVIKSLAIRNGGPIDLFTTNYDCLLNVMATLSNDLTFCTHIHNERGTFAADWFVSNTAGFNKKNPKVHVHRLHGCVAWVAESSAPYGVREIFGAGDATKKKLTINDQATLNQMAIKLLGDDLGQIPAFALAFEELCNALSRCETLLVWGHSFRDEELLRNIIRVAEKRHQHPFQVWYIDAYLKIDNVKENMEKTLKNVIAVDPSILYPLIRMLECEWKSPDPYADLAVLLDGITGLPPEEPGRQQSKKRPRRAAR